MLPNLPRVCCTCVLMRCDTASESGDQQATHLHKGAAVTLAKVKPPAIKLDVFTQPPQPVHYVPSDHRVGVVYVGCRGKHGLRLACAASTKCTAVAVCAMGCNGCHRKKRWDAQRMCVRQVNQSVCGHHVCYTKKAACLPTHHIQHHTQHTCRWRWHPMHTALRIGSSCPWHLYSMHSGD